MKPGGVAESRRRKRRELVSDRREKNLGKKICFAFRREKK
jgi:hypothetical protein